eukprot:Skav212669  [mRNA]  locus=scaffold1227:621609:630682:+ [translate_table: standard]
MVCFFRFLCRFWSFQVVRWWGPGSFLAATVARRARPQGPVADGAQPVFCSALSAQSDWRAAVAELAAEATGILLFIDPLASKYCVGTVLSALDLAFPTAVKCGGVCADLLPSRKRLAVAAHEPGDMAAGVSIHSMVSMGSCRVGPELRVTSADGQIIKQMQFDDDKEAHPAVEMLQAVSKHAPVRCTGGQWRWMCGEGRHFCGALLWALRHPPALPSGPEATPSQQLLIERSGFLLGLEAPKPLDPEKSKVYDDVWGSSERAPSYTALRRQAASCDWLLRSLEKLPGGSIVVRRSMERREGREKGKEKGKEDGKGRGERERNREGKGKGKGSGRKGRA